jgi:DNA polymerase/3'-5' exonuclease PolX
MKHQEAQRIAQNLITKMQPYCERIRIAGSIRRYKPEVKDIELVIIPKWDTDVDAGSLFPEPITVNRLHAWAEPSSDIHWIKPGVANIIPWPIKPDDKYWRGLLPSGIKLDLFIAQPSNWGMIYLIRTGSADFTTAVVTHAKRIGLPCVNGFLTRNGQPLETPEENDVFNILNLEYIAPERRTSYHSLRVIKQEG